MQRRNKRKTIMHKDILIATNNKGKVERYTKLVKSTGLDITFHTPESLGIDVGEVIENGATLLENALIKARAYEGKVAMPILANDTGFYVEGEGFVATPKRAALEGDEEGNLSEEEVSARLLAFWQGVATKHGGRVDAAWPEAFVLIDTDGTVHTAESKREVVLTDTVFGTPHMHMPVRALYISKITNKPAILHTEEEEMLEMKPVADALHSLLKWLAKSGTKA